MVQYAHTPWRDRAELLKVRQQFYPPAPPPAQAAAGSATTGHGNLSQQQEQIELEQQNAVSRVSMWMQRGSCPHMVESTGLITAAMLNDTHETRTRSNRPSPAIRLAYSAAFSRFVTGLLDSHQDKQQKQTMWSVAKTIGLPASLVETRHKCTHEQLPSLLKLRSVAKNALAWMWDYYWKHLTEDETDDASNLAIKAALLSHLESDDAARRKSLPKSLRQWDEVLVLHALSEIGDSAENPQILLRSLQLSRQILEGELRAPASQADQEAKQAALNDLDAIKADITQASSELDALESNSEFLAPRGKALEPSSQPKGWSKPIGKWKARPIGVV